MNIQDANNPPLPEIGLTQLETKINHTLPISYRSFLETYNGGKPSKDQFHIPDCGSDALIDYFFGISRPHYDIIWWIDELEDLQGQFLPIAFDPGGNLLIMDYRDGQIYYWDKVRHFECSTDEANAFWIADSFDDLLNNLG